MKYLEEEGETTKTSVPTQVKLLSPDQRYRRTCMGTKVAREKIRVMFSEVSPPNRTKNNLVFEFRELRGSSRPKPEYWSSH